MIACNADFRNIAAFVTRDRRGRVPGLPDEIMALGLTGRPMTRFPEPLRMSLSPQGRLVGLCPAGAEIRFNLHSQNALLTICAEPAPIVEIFQGPFRAGRTHCITQKPQTFEITLPANIKQLCAVARRRRLPFDPRLTRVILPAAAYIFFHSLKGGIEPPRPGQTPRRTLLVYGSSITQGSDATLPSAAYAMRTAQLLGHDLINLACGGSALCEPQMANYIARRDDWHIAVLELGVNMVLSTPPAEFRSRAEYFIDRIRRAHPRKWIFCIDMFTFWMDFQPRNRRPAAFRGIVRDLVGMFNHPRLVHLDGRTLLSDAAGLSTDLAHPSHIGMAQIAGRLARAIARRTRIKAHP